MLPSPAILKRRPVTQPPLNSEAPKASSCDHVTIAHRRQLMACPTSCFLFFCIPWSQCDVEGLDVYFDGAEAEFAGIDGGFERGDHYVIKF